jgi:hypothetical protein
LTAAALGGGAHGREPAGGSVSEMGGSGMGGSEQGGDGHERDGRERGARVGWGWARAGWLNGGVKGRERDGSTAA